MRLFGAEDKARAWRKAIRGADSTYARYAKHILCVLGDESTDCAALFPTPEDVDGPMTRLFASLLSIGLKEATERALDPSSLDAHKAALLVGAARRRIGHFEYVADYISRATGLPSRLLHRMWLPTYDAYGVKVRQQEVAAALENAERRLDMLDGALYDIGGLALCRWQIEILLPGIGRSPNRDELYLEEERREFTRQAIERELPVWLLATLPLVDDMRLPDSIRSLYIRGERDLQTVGNFCLRMSPWLESVAFELVETGQVTVAQLVTLESHRDLLLRRRTYLGHSLLHNVFAVAERLEYLARIFQSLKRTYLRACATEPITPEKGSDMCPDSYCRSAVWRFYSELADFVEDLGVPAVETADRLAELQDMFPGVLKQEHVDVVSGVVDELRRLT